jgi:hypothetical protein
VGVAQRVTLPASLREAPPTPGPLPAARKMRAGGRGEEYQRGASPRSRGATARALLEFLAHPNKRGRRECRMLDAPAASRAIISKARKHSHYRFTGIHRHSLRNGSTAYTWSPRCAGLVSHRRLRKLLPINLTPASGCQDHTISPYASAPFVWEANRVHRIPPRVNDDREPPLCRTRRQSVYSDLQK